MHGWASSRAPWLGMACSSTCSQQPGHSILLRVQLSNGTCADFAIFGLGHLACMQALWQPQALGTNSQELIIATAPVMYPIWPVDMPDGVQALLGLLYSTNISP